MEIVTYLELLPGIKLLKAKQQRAGMENKRREEQDTLMSLFLQTATTEPRTLIRKKNIHCHLQLAEKVFIARAWSE